MKITRFFTKPGTDPLEGIPFVPRTSRIAKLDPELAQLNKRLVHRQMEAMGMRAGLRAGTDLHALGWHTNASRDYMAVMREGVKKALDARDSAFGDYRTGPRTEG